MKSLPYQKTDKNGKGNKNDSMILIRMARETRMIV